MKTRRQALVGIAASTLSVAAPPVAFAQTSPRIRRNINQLPNNHELVRKYAEAVRVLKAKDPSDPHNWVNLASIHRYRCPHGNWFFLPWHRAYLHHFERICARAIGDENFALPYWDWTERLTLPTPFLDTSSPLYHPNRQRNSIVSTSAVSAETIDNVVLAPRDFEAFASFRAPDQLTETSYGGLEGGPHNTVHGDIRGHMGSTSTAGLDPIFWLHHNNVDRLWDSWLERRNTNSSASAFRNYVFRAPAGSAPPQFVQGDFVDRNGARVAPRVSEVLSSATLGYRFDALRAPAAVISAIVIPGVARNLGTTINGRALEAVDVGIGVSASARFSLGRDAAVVRIGDSGSVGELGSLIRREAGQILEQPVGGNAFLGRAVAAIELAEPLPSGVTASVFVTCNDPGAYAGQERRIFTGTIATFGHAGEDSDSHAGHGGENARGRSFRLDITNALAIASGLGSSRLGDMTLHVVAPDAGLNLVLQQPQIEFVQ